MNDTASPRVPVGIALGSNLGDRAAEINSGFAFLKSLSVDGNILCSLIIETAPVDCPPGSASFLNAVAEIEINPVTLSPQALLARLQAFEAQRGRPREHGRNSPRPLDLDILYYGDSILNESGLVIPHSCITERRFVLEPLAQIRPGLILPGLKKSVRELLVTGASADEP